MSDTFNNFATSTPRLTVTSNNVDSSHESSNGSPTSWRLSQIVSRCRSRITSNGGVCRRRLLSDNYDNNSIFKICQKCHTTFKYASEMKNHLKKQKDCRLFMKNKENHAISNKTLSVCNQTESISNKSVSNSNQTESILKETESVSIQTPSISNQTEAVNLIDQSISITNQTENIPNFLCSDCGQSFIQEKSLNRHKLYRCNFQLNFSTTGNDESSQKDTTNDIGTLSSDFHENENYSVVTSANTSLTFHVDENLNDESFFGNESNASDFLQVKSLLNYFSTVRQYEYLHMKKNIYDINICFLNYLNYLGYSK